MKPCHELAKEQIAADEAEGQANADDDSGGAAQDSSAGCTKDTDCKGDRICQNGTCETPSVSAAHAAPAGVADGRYDTSTPGVVVDTRTGLMWQREGDRLFDWNSAKAYCGRLALASDSGWRLPTISELKTLAVPGNSPPTIDTAAFPNTSPNTGYWSSSLVTGDVSSALVLYFVAGGWKGKVSTDVNFGAYVRCVRSGGGA